MDFDVILSIFEVVNPELVDALAIQRDCFSQEFDYAREAANLRMVYDRVRPRFANLDFPQPYDAAHPARPRGAPPLVTKRMLVMDACAGETARRAASDDFAARQSRGRRSRNSARRSSRARPRRRACPSRCSRRTSSRG